MSKLYQATVLCLSISILIVSSSCTFLNNHVTSVNRDTTVSTSNSNSQASMQSLATSQPSVFVYDKYIASPEMLKSSVVSKGDQSRITAAMQRAQNKESLTLGYIGGSITYGSSAKANLSFSDLVTRWWKNKFPNSKIKLVNAGISGTGSVIGVHRAYKDLLIKNPDFVVIDFAVNDTADSNVNIAYENLVRDILASSKTPGLMLLFMCTDGGYNFQDQEIKIGSHYNLPMLSYKNAIWPQIQEKKLKWADISGDFIHPNEKGHHITADLIISELEDCYSKIDQNATPEKILPDLLTPGIYVNATYLTNKTLNVIDVGGFTATNQAHWQLSDGWIAKEINKEMKFEVDAKNILLVYNKTIDGRGATVAVTVDGKFIMEINSKSDVDWEAITATQILKMETKRKHIISIKYLDKKPANCTGENFALLGVLVSG